MKWVTAILAPAICTLSFAADETKLVRVSTLHEGGARLDWLGERALPRVPGGEGRARQEALRAGRTERTVIVADLSWRPDGTAFAGYHGEGGPLEQKSRKSKIILTELQR